LALREDVRRVQYLRKGGRRPPLHARALWTSAIGPGQSTKPTSFEGTFGFFSLGATERGFRRGLVVVYDGRNLVASPFEKDLLGSGLLRPLFHSDSGIGLHLAVGEDSPRNPCKISLDLL